MEKAKQGEEMDSWSGREEKWLMPHIGFRGWVGGAQI